MTGRQPFAIQIRILPSCEIMARPFRVEFKELFHEAGYTAIAQMVARTREKDRHDALKFKLAKLMRQCGE